jgi:hypothetical protein
MVLPVYQELSLGLNDMRNIPLHDLERKTVIEFSSPLEQILPKKAPLNPRDTPRGFVLAALFDSQTRLWLPHLYFFQSVTGDENLSCPLSRAMFTNSLGVLKALMTHFIYRARGMHEIAPFYPSRNGIQLATYPRGVPATFS